MKQAVKLLKNYALIIAFLLAWSATIGSLFLSEILHFPPCNLCWYQRILMYPLAVIFIVAIKRKDPNVAYYALPLSVMGIVVALYHYMLQMGIIFKENILSCSLSTPCTNIQVQLLGFITLPFLSLIAFLLITFLMLFMLKSKNK